MRKERRGCVDARVRKSSSTLKRGLEEYTAPYSDFVRADLQLICMNPTSP